VRTYELRFTDLSQLGFQASALEDEIADIFVAVLAFTGTYGYGSQGNGDGRFMTAMVHAAIEAWSPNGIILDLRELAYEFGNTILSAIDAGRDDENEGWITPTVIVASDSSRTGLTSLLQYTNRPPQDSIFDTIESAYVAIKPLVQ
jgi:hypothetical protein